MRKPLTIRRAFLFFAQQHAKAFCQKLSGLLTIRKCRCGHPNGKEYACDRKTYSNQVESMSTRRPEAVNYKRVKKELSTARCESQSFTAPGTKICSSGRCFCSTEHHLIGSGRINLELDQTGACRVRWSKPCTDAW